MVICETCLKSVHEKILEVLNESAKIQLNQQIFMKESLIRSEQKTELEQTVLVIQKISKRLVEDEEIIVDPKEN